MRTVRWTRVIPASCLIACLAFAGCSDSDKADTPTSNSSSTTSPTATLPARTVDTTFTGEGSVEFCQFIAAFSASQQAVTNTASPANLETAFRESLTAIDQAIEVAPAEIKPDVVVISDTFKGVQSAAAAVGFDVTKMSATAIGALQDDKFLDSVTRMQAYLTTVCKAS